MRNPVAAEIFNEEVSNLLKRKIKDSVTRVDELGIAFDYEGEVTADDAAAILDKVARIYGQALEAAERATTSRAQGGSARSSPPICRRLSTASSRTSSSRTCCGSSTTWSPRSRARSSCGRRWWRSATSRRTGRGFRVLKVNNRKAS